MSNRGIWFFILLAAIWWACVFYWYGFVFNISSLQIQSNQSNYQITLDSQQQILQHSCEQTNCELSEIPSFDFTLIASKQGYKNIEKKLDLHRGQNTIELNFQKDYTPIKVQSSLDQNDQEILDSLGDTQKIIEEKRQELKKSQNLYFLAETQKNKYYFYQKSPEILNIWKNNQDLWNIDFIEKQNIEIFEIQWNQNEFIIKNDKNYFLFHILQKTFQEIIFTIEINYVKQIDANNYIFVTPKWPFLWKKNKNIFEYNHLFTDYILYENSYIWYINSDNISLKNKFFENVDNSKTIFYQYNPQTKEKNILFQSDYRIEKLYIQDTKVFIQDKNKQLYQIPHL